MRYVDLVNRYPIISDQIEPDELKVILRELSKVIEKGVPGDVVEFGCYAGTTSLFLQRMLSGNGKRLFVYDSFEGLPEKTERDTSPVGTQFIPGKLHATKQQFIMNFRKAGLPIPMITKGWFGDLGPDAVPHDISFAFLDGDYYESVNQPLRLIWPRMQPGSTIIVDDYQNEALPGASRAVDEWTAEHAVRSIRIEASLAILYV